MIRRTRRGMATLLAACGFAAAAGAQSFDHSAFDALLKANVVNGMVNYDAFRTAPSFAKYLALLAATNPPTLSRDEQLAFWINAYNAYTIQLIVAHHERASIRNINKTLFLKLRGPWSEPIATVAGKPYTLDEIEHKVIRPTFREPRIHMALVCGAMGCPALRSEAYVAVRLSAQLDDQGAAFVLRSPAKNRVDLPGNTWYRNLIFSLYREDFGGSVRSAAKFVAQWYPDGAEKQLLLGGRFTSRQTDYDWTLNSQENLRKMASR